MKLRFHLDDRIELIPETPADQDIVRHWAAMTNHVILHTRSLMTGWPGEEGRTRLETVESLILEFRTENQE
jgi:hypothetical protein